ncbi:hypothetical protein NMY22_g18582 [Coprinellus aureogranulatus]|nr:hypothetical protein NMY22_g18582 [Coprinellus aureogranulatus]
MDSFSSLERFFAYTYSLKGSFTDIPLYPPRERTSHQRLPRTTIPSADNDIEVKAPRTAVNNEEDVLLKEVRAAGSPLSSFATNVFGPFSRDPNATRSMTGGVDPGNKKDSSQGCCSRRAD